ncbi:efflux RND transporter periplasmic adaptor subunit [Paracraurococcus lichenis]|uniref:Efflux RND transporter periplasmic adaptor subunit n=1 Tax=Paracraurococcus lichenis TaxID=3064888 RepID=A0ABT9E4W8_9PROT|nr:efflux RND transporter periplasmic adaptor subunit [Paracraurococcus sp. LOR1-02]MDO9711212.1 efflux RND transporter periplasmic adaptor subunit [Paracraurococcus sp. LOR1-02]
MDSLPDLASPPRARSRRGLLLPLGLTAIAAAGAGYWLGHQAPPPPEAAGAATRPELPAEVSLSPEAARNFGLRTAAAEMRPLVRSIRVTGSVGFNELRLAHIQPLARGRVQSVEVAIGDRVRAGQRLAVLDALDLAEARHQLSGAEAALNQAQAETQTARAAFNRAQELVRSGALSQSELERRRAEVARAEAAVLTRRTEVEHWREMLARYSPASTAPLPPGSVSLPAPTPMDARGAILAPFDGAILAVGATPGELVDTNREIFTLADLSTVWVMADVPERDLGAVQAGAAVSIAVEAYPGRRFPGRVAYVADQLDARTGTAKVRCEIPNPEGALRVNMFAIVEIAAPLGREGLVVPDAALQAVDDQPGVFLRTGEDRFAWRRVQPGLRQGGVTEVTEGLQPGETVAAEGSFRLKALLLHDRVDAQD